jgi:hypothetical protein
MSRRARAWLLSVLTIAATTTMMWVAAVAEAGIQGSGR